MPKNIVCLLFSSLFVFSVGLHSQTKTNKWIENYQLTVYYGTTNTDIEIMPLAANIDYMNYFSSWPEGADYDHLRICNHFWFKKNWEAEARLHINSGWRFDGLGLKLIYYPLKPVGISVSYTTMPLRIEKFDTFHENEDVDMTITNTDDSRTIYNKRFMMGFNVPLEYRRIHCVFRLNGGISRFEGFDVAFVEKQPLSNFKRKIQYEVSPSVSPFIQPELEINIDCIKTRRNVMGVHFNTNWCVQRSSYDYTRTIYTWTYEDKVIDKIKAPAHRFSSFEMNGGIFIKW